MDGGYSQRESVELPVQVFISRNQYPPVFVGDPYEVLVHMPVSAGQVLTTVTARDEDTVYVSV